MGGGGIEGWVRIGRFWLDCGDRGRGGGVRVWERKGW